MIASLLGMAVKWAAREAGRDAFAEKAKKDFDQLLANQEDILKRLSAGHNLDKIADDYAARFGIAQPRTLLAAADIVYAIKSSDDPIAQKVVRLMASSQRIDSVTPARAFVAQLSDGKTIYSAGKAQGARVGSNFAEGIYVLSTAYLYFFPWRPTYGFGAARAKGMASGALESAIPGFGIVSGIWEVGSAAAEGTADFFSSSMLTELAGLLEAPAAWVIPLAKVTSFTTNPVGERCFFNVTASDSKNQSYECVLGQPGKDEREWASHLANIMPLACLAEGVLMSVRK